MLSNYPPGVTGNEPYLTGVCEYCGEESCGEEGLCEEAARVERELAPKVEAAGMDRIAALEAVADKRAIQQNANAHFIEAVKDASAMGCSIRQIAQAAGYKSTSPVQHILNKDT